MMVPGARALLDALKSRGIELYLASGTDNDYVIREAKLLGIDHYFDGGIQWGTRQLRGFFQG